MLDVVCPLSDLTTIIADQAPDAALADAVRGAEADLVIA
jgi:hypothetical protein